MGLRLGGELAFLASFQIVQMLLIHRWNYWFQAQWYMAVRVTQWLKLKGMGDFASGRPEIDTRN